MHPDITGIDCIQVLERVKYEKNNCIDSGPYFIMNIAWIARQYWRNWMIARENLKAIYSYQDEEVKERYAMKFYL